MARSDFYGHENMVRLMIELGANNYNEIMIIVARTCHESIVGIMLEKGANDYYEAMDSAARAGNENIILSFLHFWSKTNTTGQQNKLILVFVEIPEVVFWYNTFKCCWCKSIQKHSVWPAKQSCCL